MGNPVKPQLVAVPLILFLVIGSCTAAAHPWRRALVRNDDAVSWNAAAAYTNSRTAPRGVNSKAATVEQRVSEPLVYSARGGAAGSHATPSWSQHTAASRVGTAAPHAVHYAATPDAASPAAPHAVHYAATPDAASHAAPHAVHYAATTDAASHAAPHAVHYAATTRGAPHAARNAVNHGSHGPGNANLPAAANQHRGGVSRHDGNGGGTIAVNGAFRAASANDVAIHHRSSHERHTRDERSSGGPVGRHIQPSSSGGFTGGVLAPPLWSLPRDRPRWPFHKAGASDVAFHRRNGGGNSNARGANHPGSYQRVDGVNRGSVGMAFARTNAAGDYGGDYSGGDYSGGDYNGGDNGGDYNGGDNGGDYNGGDNGGDYNGGDNGGDYNGGDYNGGDNGGDYNGGENGGDYNGGILEEHNKARQEVGVPDLAWDDGVAATAQEWANELASKGCPLEHGGAEGLGQNLYWLSPAGLTPQEDRGAVQSWVEEKADWTPSPIPDGCADGKMCGHYTQVVWRDTTHVGCASAQCPDGSGMWVCNYSPPGNFAGQTPF
ncbi:unnamed protein product [Closterium sp. Naga37s-1]|nr:unnamed protein product [Closterium sp. Naga37s-1]